MPFKNCATPSGAKPASAPRSAVAKRKHLPARKRGPAKKSASPSSATHRPKKARRHTAALSTLKSRQLAVERAKLQVWRHLHEINGAIIKLAESGSYLAARSLFDFAGVYTLPPLEEETASSVLLPVSPATAAALPAGPPEMAPPPVNKIEAFLQTLGLDPLSDEEPEPDMAA
jgi:hypothetical protein